MRDRPATPDFAVPDFAVPDFAVPDFAGADLVARDDPARGLLGFATVVFLVREAPAARADQFSLTGW
jgi:hypothetical protein